MGATISPEQTQAGVSGSEKVRATGAVPFSMATNVVGGGALAGFCDLVDALGGSSSSVMERFGFAMEEAGDPAQSLPLASVASAIEAAALHLDCPDFGLRLGDARDVSSLGPIAQLLDHDQTVGDAAGALVRHLSLYSPAMRVRFKRLDTQRGRFLYAMYLPGVADQRHSNELALRLAHRILQTLSGEEQVASVVYLPHRLGRSSAAYHLRFGCQVVPDQPFCGFDFRLELLDRPLRLARPHAPSSVHDDLARSLPVEHDVLGAVMEFVDFEMASDSADLEFVASRLGLHPRTLQRRLAEAGVSFNAVVDGVRRSRAERYLVESDLSLAAIATQLGYSEQSCLSRSCMRWFGRTPMGIRQAAVA